MIGYAIIEMNRHQTRLLQIMSLRVCYCMSNTQYVLYESTFRARQSLDQLWHLLHTIGLSKNLILDTQLLSKELVCICFLLHKKRLTGVEPLSYALQFSLLVVVNPIETLSSMSLRRCFRKHRANRHRAAFDIAPKLVATRHADDFFSPCWHMWKLCV